MQQTRRVRATVLVLISAVGLGAPTAVEAQRDSIVAAALNRFRSGQPIQVGLLRSRWAGRYERVGGDTLFMRSRGQPAMAFRFSAIDTLWREEDRFRRGAAIGGITGAILIGVAEAMLAEALARGDGSPTHNSFGVTLLAGLAGGVVGALLGGAIGAAFNRWERVYP